MHDRLQVVWTRVMEYEEPEVPPTDATIKRGKYSSLILLLDDTTLPIMGGGSGLVAGVLYSPKNKMFFSFPLQKRLLDPVCT